MITPHPRLQVNVAEQLARSIVAATHAPSPNLIGANESRSPIGGERLFQQPARPFQWGLGIEQKNRSDSERTLFEEAAKFGIRCGFTFPIHDGQGAIAALSFATDEHRTAFDRSLIEHTQTLRLIAWFFHAHAKRFWTIDRMVGGVVLSPREYECLEWSARGKSAGEIGIILGIAERTAGFHLDNARAKLGVSSLRQAIVLLTESKSRK
ncbi:autoinducer binding domain-containing protein [Bradyrhizobium sp. S3.2.12]|uniref:helix-turn-helix transcriptional regulator n=1 Tax=Bradyrhizobium sp. S3.2.12 TaxID=3156387 RepID=UPI0033977F40